MAFQGSKKATDRDLPGALEMRVTLTEGEVHNVARLYDDTGEPNKATFVFVAWNFLMRVRSECFGFQKGEASELIVLPAKRHSAVFTEAAGGIIVRWARRTHTDRKGRG